MSTSIKFGDDFMRIPTLDEAGENWVTHKVRCLKNLQRDIKGY